MLELDRCITTMRDTSTLVPRPSTLSNANSDTLLLGSFDTLQRTFRCILLASRHLDSPHRPSNETGRVPISSNTYETGRVSQDTHTSPLENLSPRFCCMRHQPQTSRPLYYTPPRAITSLARHAPRFPPPPPPPYPSRLAPAMWASSRLPSSPPPPHLLASHT